MYERDEQLLFLLRSEIPGQTEAELLENYDLLCDYVSVLVDQVDCLETGTVNDRQRDTLTYLGDPTNMEK